MKSTSIFGLQKATAIQSLLTTAKLRRLRFHDLRLPSLRDSPAITRICMSRPFLVQAFLLLHPHRQMVTCGAGEAGAEFGQLRVTGLGRNNSALISDMAENSC